MTLTAIDGEPRGLWSDALAAAYSNCGADPYLVWTNALEEVGSSTKGPDPSGEYSSNCPAPGHNGGGGDAKASLRWRQAPDGKLLAYCHAGCDGEDIVTTLGLTFTQLRWPRTEYYYRSDLREMLAVHVKAPTAGGKKRYWWEHYENDTLITGRGSGWEPVLWCLPDLQAAAEQAHTEHRKVRLVLCEGESDVITATAAFEAGWTPPGEQDWLHLVTTSADGAASWSRELTSQILGLSIEQITILCDSDETGLQRGATIAEALIEADPTLSIQTLSWVGQDGVKDASDAIARFGRNWLREASAAAEADAYLWCSTETGWLFEADAEDLEGRPTGRRALHRMISVGTRGVRPEAITKWPIRVIACTVDTVGDSVGWELDLGAGGTRPITSDDLVSTGLESWNSKIGLFIVPTRGLGAALRAYLGYHSANSPQLSVYEHEGWVDQQTFVTGTEILVGPAGQIGRAAAGSTEWHYGDAGSAEAARICADILTFRPLAESAPVLAWLAAVSVRPRSLEASGASFVPMLQIPGDSGTGKTSFLRLATRLFGVSGAAVSNVTTAGLVRTLALSTQVVWIDDFSNYDETVRNIIRGGLTGAGRTRGTTASERGIVRDEARAALVNSGEAAMGLDERAMRQRSVVVPFTERAQGRTSRRAGADHGQYADMVEMGVDKDDRGQGLSRWAGSVVKGLWDAAQRLNKSSDNTGATGLSGAADGVREAAAWRFVEYGAEVLVDWMAAEGIPPERTGRLIRAVRKRVQQEVRAAELREKSGADIHLVTTLVPMYLRTRRAIFDTGVSGRLRDGETLDGAAVMRMIRDSWRNADAGARGQLIADGRPARGVVLMIAPSQDEEEGEQVVAMALCSSALAEWAQSEDGRRAGVGADRRFVTKEGIGMQIGAIASKGEQWNAGGGPASKIRVKLSASQTPLYSVVTEPDVLHAILGVS